MNQLGMIHPSMLAAIPQGVYPSLCTIRTATGTQDAYGHVEPTTWVDLAGHVNIACRIAPRLGLSMERRQPEQVYAEATLMVSLSGYYPGIFAHMQAVIDGVAYDIKGVEHDGNRITTRLYARLLE